MGSQHPTFSVALGLVDFLNPVLMTLTMLTLMKAFQRGTDQKVFRIGAVIALAGGYLIPAGKIIVGLGLIDFVMPVTLVHLVNTGILIAGFTFFLECRGRTYKALPVWEDALLAAAYFGGTVAVSLLINYNTAAVLTGALGILFIYISVILLAMKNHRVLPIVLVALSCCLTGFLAIVGSTWNVYTNPGVHWVIEITNAICQCSLFIAARISLRSI